MTTNETTINTDIGPFRLIHWGDSIVLTETHHGQTHTVNGVAYNIRVDLSRGTHGPWRIAHIYATRSDYRTPADFNPTPAARKRIAHSTLLAVSDLMATPGGEILWQHGYIAIAEQRAATLRHDIERLERELKEKRAELQKQENQARWCEQTIARLEITQQPAYA